MLHLSRKRKGQSKSPEEKEEVKYLSIFLVSTNKNDNNEKKTKSTLMTPPTAMSLLVMMFLIQSSSACCLGGLGVRTYIFFCNS